MNKSNKISQELQVVSGKAHNLYSDLLKQHGEFDFVKEQHPELDFEEALDELLQNGEVDALPLIEFRNSITGNCFDLYILKVHDDGITCIDFEGDRSEQSIKYLASLEDLLVLLNEMEELVK